MEMKEQIVSDIETNPIILYMKGTKEMPMCGFSNSVVKVLNHYGVEYKDVNVLEDPMIRVKLSEHSNWPTIPPALCKRRADRWGGYHHGTAPEWPASGYTG